jgi:hypothetical protein
MMSARPERTDRTFSGVGLLLVHFIVQQGRYESNSLRRKEKERKR